MKNIIILSLLTLSCASQYNNYPDSKLCNQPEGSYTATYTEVSGTCGKGATESFDETKARSWFPTILDLDDCTRVTSCDDGIIYGSSSCTRVTAHAEGTLDGDLVFDTRSNTGTIQIMISTVNFHGSRTCESVYNVSYNVE